MAQRSKTKYKSVLLIERGSDSLNDKQNYGEPLLLKNYPMTKIQIFEES